MVGQPNSNPNTFLVDEASELWITQLADHQDIPVGSSNAYEEGCTVAAHDCTRLARHDQLGDYLALQEGEKKDTAIPIT